LQVIKLHCFLFLMSYHIRLLIAGLHFNENFKHEQEKTKDGDERMRICFPKPKYGEFTPKPVPVSKNYSMLLNILGDMQCITTTIYYRVCRLTNGESYSLLSA